MKICLIIDDYLPDSIKVGAKMMHELACELHSQGHEVTVVTPSSKIEGKMQLSTLDDIHICRFKNGEIKNVSKIKRAIHETLLSFNAWRHCNVFFKENPHDLIIYYSPTIFWGMLVAKLKKLWGVKSYLILRDFFPQWTIDNGLMQKHSLITYYFKFFEKVNYKAADTIGVMSEKNLAWFSSYYKKSDNIEVLYNWSKSDKYIGEKDKYRKQLKLEDKVIFFYGGNMGHAQDMLNLIRLAHKLKDEPRTHFLFVGAGDEVALMEEHIEKFQLSNTTLLPSVDQEEFKQILSEVDVGLFTLNKNHQTHNFPGKLLGYMTQALPILGSVNPDNDLQILLESYDAGFITINGEDTLFYKNALKLLDEKERKKIGENGRKLLIDKFAVSSIARRINKEGQVTNIKYLSKFTLNSKKRKAHTNLRGLSCQ